MSRSCKLLRFLFLTDFVGTSYASLNWHQKGERISAIAQMRSSVKSEQLDLINQLDEEDKSTVFKIIDTMLTKKKFQNFFQKNLPAAQ